MEPETGPARRSCEKSRQLIAIAFDPAASTSEVLKGALSDAGDGPLEVTGTIQLKPDGSYLVETLVAARPDAPRDLLQTLEFLGPPDAQGRRPYTTEGTF
ncbi:type II secretion system protein N [Steroidobacter cummioxidans]|uniref:type II secretion system protein N n=1 Tax=Steroidobacter cummioxidans TaxID=1803913 RepID=UPI00137A6651|nr:type II secretion system protein N [Steroidobacter cummioxidans]